MREVVTLRAATAADVAAIKSLTRDAYKKWVAVIGREPKPMTADYGEAVRNHRIDLLFADGDFVALIEMIPGVDNLPVENVAVAPGFQGRGFGRHLMAHAESVAASLGYSEIKLYTNKLFTDNLKLYGELGYRVEREEAFKGGFAVHMNKQV